MTKESKYIPYPFYWDDTPIDISFVFKGEKPAGKHGFLKVSGGKFVFEDGTKAKFWGTNFNNGLNFPPFDFTEKIAERLAKIGINIVRFHQMDAEWANPNIFQFSKGERIGNTLSLDPKSVNAEGFYTGAIPSVYENGTLKFRLGEEFASMHYLIQAE